MCAELYDVDNIVSSLPDLEFEIEYDENDDTLSSSLSSSLSDDEDEEDEDEDNTVFGLSNAEVPMLLSNLNTTTQSDMTTYYYRTITFDDFVKAVDIVGIHPLPVHMKMDISTTRVRWYLHLRRPKCYSGAFMIRFNVQTLTRHKVNYYNPNQLHCKDERGRYHNVIDFITPVSHMHNRALRNHKLLKKTLCHSCTKYLPLNTLVWRCTQCVNYDMCFKCHAKRRESPLQKVFRPPMHVVAWWVCATLMQHTIDTEGLVNLSNYKRYYATLERVMGILRNNGEQVWYHRINHFLQKIRIMPLLKLGKRMNMMMHLTQRFTSTFFKH